METILHQLNCKISTRPELTAVLIRRDHSTTGKRDKLVVFGFGLKNRSDKILYPVWNHDKSQAVTGYVKMLKVYRPEINAINLTKQLLITEN